MKLYIRATGNVSPQNTFGQADFLSELVDYTGNRLKCIEPDYKKIIDPKFSRRMGRIVKMGVAAALGCLHEASLKIPDAIVTGTALGCMEDSGLFLTKMVENNEELLTPTAFIQSTHNTIGAQIALLLNCHSYNNTFVHRGFSFESALLDSMMLLQENEVSTVLVGGIDEITNISHTVMTRMGLYKRKSISNLNLFNSPTKGTLAGEGAAFFLLANQPSETDYAQLDGIATFYKPKSTVEIEHRILLFLAAKSVAIEEVDLVLMGRSGDVEGDEVFNQISNSIFKGTETANYKHLCGEYHTATAFALWLAVSIIKFGLVPQVVGNVDLKEKEMRKILIYNHYQTIHHSLILVSSC